MQTILLLIVFAVPPQAPMPPQAPPILDPPCQGCDCGCAEGLPCTCGTSKKVEKWFVRLGFTPNTDASEWRWEPTHYSPTRGDDPFFATKALAQKECDRRNAALRATATPATVPVVTYSQPVSYSQPAPVWVPAPQPVVYRQPQPAYRPAPQPQSVPVRTYYTPQPTYRSYSQPAQYAPRQAAVCLPGRG